MLKIITIHNLLHLEPYRRLVLRIMNLNLETSRHEIILNFRILSRRFHPSKWYEGLSFSKEEGTEKFKEIANAQDLSLEIDLTKLYCEFCMNCFSFVKKFLHIFFCVMNILVL